MVSHIFESSSSSSKALARLKLRKLEEERELIERRMQQEKSLMEEQSRILEEKYKLLEEMVEMQSEDESVSHASFAPRAHSSRHSQSNDGRRTSDGGSSVSSTSRRDSITSESVPPSSASRKTGPIGRNSGRLDASSRVTPHKHQSAHIRSKDTCLLTHK